ncbi:hypothetical protein KP509_35G066600 [Ceratopteris richardii]|uniref:Methyltransferase-like protein 22 n=1 Tax=Ceratopteris richardii TaxID=49495 RepID=A0A8T2QHL8_CERRI|nr:hypothetical protein KP509_35G066600 [Ceratopteris richardii]
MEDDEVVTSEVHLGCPPHEVSCLSIFTIASSPRTFDDGEKPQTFREQCIPRVICSLNEEVSSSDNFDISTNSSLSDRSVISVDECGDLVIPRRNRNYHAYGDIQESTISIYHHVKTTLSRVGLQIWKASLLLGDFLLHKIQTTDELAGVVGIELGAGTGILGILLAAKARVVFLTDLDTEVLDNCLRNVILNSRKSKKIDSSIRIRQLDWKQPWPPIDETPDVENSIENKSFPYSWCKSDLIELERLNIILAADVIYSNDLTDSCFSLLRKLMPPGSRTLLWLALEKRFNFSISDLDVVAHGYDHFRSFVEDRTPGSALRPTLQTHNVQKLFAGRKLSPYQIPQYLTGYERTKDLELWEIWRM